jgi:putative protease
VGDWVWRTHDPDLDKVTRRFTHATAPVHKQPVDVVATARVGEPLAMEWRLKTHRVRVQSDSALEPSQKHPLTLELLRDQLGRLGNTAYALSNLEAIIEGNPFVPSSLLNDLRRRAVTQLEALQDRKVVVKEGVRRPVGERLTRGVSVAPQLQLQLHLLIRTPDQLDAAIATSPASITLDYLDLYGLRPAVERVQSSNIAARVASPRVLKPEEQRIVSFLLDLNCEIVVRSTGLLHALRFASNESSVSSLIGDFSLNAANALTAQAFLDLGLKRLTPTHDLNASQIADLAHAIGSDKLEVIAYQHLPVFHTEHCVFCRFLSTGTSYEDCGRPCEKHRVALRDTNGREHPVMADVGCRNTVFGAEAQEASQHLQSWRDAGIAHYRLEFVHETADQVAGVTAAFVDALQLKCTYADLRARLKRLSPQGITEGSLFVPAEMK